jgi:hypothetical protein
MLTSQVVVVVQAMWSRLRHRALWTAPVVLASMVQMRTWMRHVVS